MTVKKFEKDKYYRFIGPKLGSIPYWGSDMNLLKDGLPHKCELVGKEYQHADYGFTQGCRFSGTGSGHEWQYIDAHRQLFEEVNADGSALTQDVIGSDAPSEDDIRKRVLGYL